MTFAAQIYRYPALIKEVYLDVYGHVNNTVYLTLFEEARWELITKNGYGLDKIMSTGLGPVILGVSMRFQKELRVREEIVIESVTISYQQKIGKMSQTIIRGDVVCCTAEFTFGLFNLQDRKLVMPTADWLNALGIPES